MEWFLLDAMSPFARGHEIRRINWSKIPFSRLTQSGPERREHWDRIASDLRRFAGEATSAGFNAVSCDDLAHLALHPALEPDVAASIKVFREEFTALFDLLKYEFGLGIFLTSDVLPTTAAVLDVLGDSPVALDAYYRDLIRNVLDDFPQLSGLILRIGESDGLDVTDPIRTHLHLKTPADANRLIKQLLSEFEQRDRTMILRTWTVGAHPIGDLIWHSKTLGRTLAGIDSPNFIVSMKHGESDFFRYLPLNPAFFTVSQPKILELQARREYEGAGEYPSFTGWECERMARELEKAENVVGLSVWCQTGGWHRFQRLAFLESDRRDVWIRLNTLTTLRIFKNRQTVEQAIAEIVGESAAAPTLELLRHSDTLIRELLYVSDFAKQKHFFRRVRIPPLLHVYWDCLFVNFAVRAALRHFVADRDAALRSGEAAFALFPRMLVLAEQAQLPIDDIEHMRDLFHLILLARRFYFSEAGETIQQEILAAKKAYKARWPKSRRYRIKTDFSDFHLKRRTLKWTTALLLRRKRGYRFVDHLFTLTVLGVAFRFFQRRFPKRIPKFLRKSAMGVESLFR